MALREDIIEVFRERIEHQNEIKCLKAENKRLREVLSCISGRGISGMGYKADYECCVNMALEALERMTNES